MTIGDVRFTSDNPEDDKDVSDENKGAEGTTSPTDPEPTELKHTIVRGDTLYELAKK